MTVTDRTLRNWCHPRHPLAAAVADHLRTPQALGAAAPVEPVEPAAGLRDTLLGTSLPDMREQLGRRWDGLFALANFARTRRAELLEAARTAFDAVLPPAAGKAPPPDVVADVLDRWRVRAGDFAAADWTAGRFLVFDWLQDRVAAPARIAEATPVLFAGGADLGTSDAAAVYTLAVERMDGGPGLIGPDLWAMGLLRFGRTGGADFQAITEAALAAGGCSHRLRWRLAHRAGTLADLVKDRSGEVAAVCCARAVADRTSPTEPPLLDPQAAVTGTWDRPSHAVGPVGGLDEKLRVAAHLLTVVVHSRNQSGLPSTAPGKLHLQPVGTTDEAYEQLLVTTKMLADLKAALCRDWEERYHAKSTDPVYLAAARRR